MAATTLSTTVDWHPLDLPSVHQLLPHRAPFLFVDHAELDRAGGRSRTWRRFHSEESYFEGHFPEMPIVPGVVLLECMAQAGRLWVNAHAGGIRAGFLVGVEAAKFHQTVRPGDLLRTEALHCGESDMTIGKSSAAIHRFKCSAFVEGRRCARAQILLYQDDASQAHGISAGTTT